MTITVIPPDGYDNVEYVIIVNKEQLMGHRLPEFCVSVVLIRPDGNHLIEEVGCGGGLGSLLHEAGSVIRNSDGLSSAISRHPAGKQLEESIARGLAQSAAGEVVDLGNYPYLTAVPYRGSPVTGLTGDNEEQP